ncbi:MAG: hypothetical protein AAF693_12725 [Bacteroidota bacterium]
MMKALFICTLIFTCLVPNAIHGQFKNYNTENEQWFQGRIKLLSGRSIDGELNYNFVSQVLRLRESNNIEIYNAEEVLFFLLITSNDESELYYSLPYLDQDYGRKRAVFFKVLHETKKLAILSRLIFEFKDRNWPLDSNPNAANSLSIAPADYKVEKVQEVIYLADNKGTIRHYMEGKKSKSLSSTLGYDESFYRAGGKSVLKYNDDKFKSSQVDRDVRKYKVIDKDIVLEFLDDEYYNVQEYIKENQINLSTIKGLIQILDFYEELTYND